MGDLEKNCGRISCVITIFFTFVAIIGSLVMNYMTYTGTGKLKGENSVVLLIKCSFQLRPCKQNELSNRDFNKKPKLCH